MIFFLSTVYKRKINFHIINIRTQGYITLNKYILILILILLILLIIILILILICIAIKGLPKVNLWATKYVTKRL